MLKHLQHEQVQYTGEKVPNCLNGSVQEEYPGPELLRGSTDSLIISLANFEVGR